VPEYDVRHDPLLLARKNHLKTIYYKPRQKVGIERASLVGDEDSPSPVRLVKKVDTVWDNYEVCAGAGFPAAAFGALRLQNRLKMRL
jgi:hypothetical protein